VRRRGFLLPLRLLELAGLLLGRLRGLRLRLVRERGSGVFLLAGSEPVIRRVRVEVVARALEERLDLRLVARLGPPLGPAHVLRPDLPRPLGRLAAALALVVGLLAGAAAAALTLALGRRFRLTLGRGGGRFLGLRLPAATAGPLRLRLLRGFGRRLFAGFLRRLRRRRGRLEVDDALAEPVVVVRRRGRCRNGRRGRPRLAARLRLGPRRGRRLVHDARREVVLPLLDRRDLGLLDLGHLLGDGALLEHAGGELVGLILRPAARRGRWQP
jgi:hypothetical protein